MHTHRLPTLINTTKDLNHGNVANIQALSSQEKQELRQGLIRIQEQAKVMNKKHKDSQESEAGNSDIAADPTDFSKVNELPLISYD